ncbi:putative membrane protein [Azospirillum fermentarium]|uniref:YMGG-like glycine zipper-containing protein n=1 Tax=Azospirillum fermentarium TaxID=1233114 RepID=UPI0022266DB6|nr:YMGG-like glycine zipper-containing protein [Azospirillum fermentarium]MCW2244903.1 putative membrane protein [Azospirillum fermentarium]
MLTRKFAAAAMAAALLAGCSNLSHRENRALMGAGIGAAGGAVIGSVTGGSPWVGGLIGGAGGAAVGALSGGR